MDHIAIMHKNWGLIPKILDGWKTIESRWSKFKITPFGKVNIGDTVYFKNSGQNVTTKAEVFKVVQFENLNSEKVEQILEKYGGNGQIGMTDLESSFKFAKDKKYCTLIYLKNPKKVKPFAINKTGFGSGSAWLSVGNINKIRI